jgi:hypothetical protein
VDKDIKEDKKLPFNKPSVLYNKVLGGLEDKVVILEAGEDNNLEAGEDNNWWLNNIKVLHSTILSNSY